MSALGGSKRGIAIVEGEHKPEESPAFYLKGG